MWPAEVAKACFFSLAARTSWIGTVCPPICAQLTRSYEQRRPVPYKSSPRTARLPCPNSCGPRSSRDVASSRILRGSHCRLGLNAMTIRPYEAVQ